MPTLIVTDGPAEGRQFALGEHRLVMVGRDSDCTFQILDPHLSRRHLQLRREDDGSHTAIDRGSRNGVLINGTRIEADTTLGDGDEIAIGDSALVYTTSDSPDAMSIKSVVHKRGERFKGTITDG